MHILSCRVLATRATPSSRPLTIPRLAPAGQRVLIKMSWWHINIAITWIDKQPLLVSKLDSGMRSWPRAVGSSLQWWLVTEEEKDISAAAHPELQDGFASPESILTHQRRIIFPFLGMNFTRRH